MADKQAALSIVIRTVDQATAKLNHITEHLEKMQKPYRDLGKAFSKFTDATGLERVKEGFAGVGEAVKGIGEHLLHIAEAAGLGTYEIVHLIHEFAELGNMAKDIGITADALAGLRYSAANAGVSSEELDGAMLKFNKTLGELHRKTGTLYELLSKVSPELLKQVGAAKTSKEALGVLADAMARLPDPTKRALLSTAAFGKSGARLISWMSEGSKAIDGNIEEYEHLAGSQEGAVESAETMHKAMLKLGAIFDGLKGKMLEGLAPAFLKISDALEKFLVAHKDEIIAFITDFGEKLPGRIDALMDKFNSVLDAIKPVWDAIGGMTGASIILAGVISTKLIIALVELGIALYTNPLGLVAVGIGVLIAAITLLVAHWDALTAAVKSAADAVEHFLGIGVNTPEVTAGGIFGDAQRKLLNIPEVTPSHVIEGVTDLAKRSLFGDAGPPAPPAAAATTAKTETTIKVDFANAPKGTRVSTDARGPQQVDLSVGYQMVLP